MDDVTTQILQLLERCVRDEPFPSTLLAALERREDLSPQMSALIHELHHFADDEDLRKRDVEYAQYWAQRLRELRDSIANNS